MTAPHVDVALDASVHRETSLHRMAPAGESPGLPQRGGNVRLGKSRRGARWTPAHAASLAMIAMAGVVATLDTTGWVHAGYQRSPATGSPDAAARLAQAPTTGAAVGSVAGPVVGDEAYWLTRPAAPAGQRTPIAPVADTSPQSSTLPQPVRVGDKIAIGIAGVSRVYTVATVEPAQDDVSRAKTEAQLQGAPGAGAHGAMVVTLQAPADGLNAAHTLQLVLPPHADVSTSGVKAL